MRISKSSFSAEVHCVSQCRSNPAFRYLLYQSVDGQDTLLFESSLYQEMSDCVVSADDHLEARISREACKPRVLCSAA